MKNNLLKNQFIFLGFEKQSISHGQASKCVVTTGSRKDVVELQYQITIASNNCCYSH